VGGQKGQFAGTTSNTTITFNLTNGIASTPAADDLVVVSFCTGSTVDQTLDIETTGAVDYTLIGSELYANDTFDTNMRVAYRKMPGTPETQFRFAGGSLNAADAAVWTVQVYRGVDTTTPMDVTATTATGIDTRLANPASITPSTAGALIGISGCGAGSTGGNYDTTYLGDRQTTTQVDTNDALIASGWHLWKSGAYDGAVFTNGGTDTTSDSWAAVTYALRPAVTTPFTDARAAIASGCDSAQSEGTGWDARRSTILPTANVVRTSDTVATLTFAADATYNITAQETVTCTVPAAALDTNAAIASSPTFTIDATMGTSGLGLLTVGVGE